MVLMSFLQLSENHVTRLSERWGCDSCQHAMFKYDQFMGHSLNKQLLLVQVQLRREISAFQFRQAGQ